MHKYIDRGNDTEICKSRWRLVTTEIAKKIGKPFCIEYMCECLGCDPLYRVRTIIEYFRSKHVPVSEWPHQSPDQSAIENMSQNLKMWVQTVSMQSVWAWTILKMKMGKYFSL